MILAEIKNLQETREDHIQGIRNKMFRPGGMDRNDPRYQEFLDKRRIAAGLSDDEIKSLAELPPKQSSMIASSLGSYEPDYSTNVDSIESAGWRTPTPEGTDTTPDLLGPGEGAPYQRSEDKGAWMRGYNDGADDAIDPLKGEFDQWQPAPHDRLVRMKGKSYASGYREGLNTFSPKGW